MKGSVGNIKISAGLALAVGLGTLGTGTAAAQSSTTPWPSPTQAIAPIGPPSTPQAAAPAPNAKCNAFLPLRDDAQKKGAAIGAGQKRHVERKEMCTLVSAFYISEGKVLKFLEDNLTTCGVPREAVTMAKASHEKTLKFRDAVCAPAPQPRGQTLSDAIGTPTLDTAKNTKTGHGTFDTLTGNPLAK